ncbi:MAG: methyl-accepting chemotaxis protein [Lachnospiraceae bacterium]|nr:methyl-accepting chemotaxis protein [Lachnospiraceae bacterium]
MKWLNNVSVRAKLLIISVPLAVALIISVVFMGTELSSTESQMTAVYYDTLYQVNSNLLNADRDFYQAMEAAMQYYDFSKGYTEAPADFAQSMLPGNLADFADNRQQVYDRVTAAEEIACKDADLYNNTKTEDGRSYYDVMVAWRDAMNVWESSYDLESNTGDWEAFHSRFSEARDGLNDLQEITESWASAKHDALTKALQAKVVSVVVVFAILILVLATIAVAVIRGIRIGIKKVTDDLDELANGNLTLEYPADREIGRDEIGQITKSAKRLTEKLNEVLGKTRQMSDELTTAGSELAENANQATLASEQVTDAVTEISKGAVAQAESVENAVGNTDDIGRNIETITEDVKGMDNYAAEMKQACDKAMDALDKLIRQSNEVTRSVKDIGDTINSTNESAKTISEFTQAITDIATQTNLLSLNASIEAARAGDAGRGFAVVADEIRQLADQSSNSADKIKGIVEKLLADSASSVSVLEKLNESFGIQEEQLDMTRTNMETMSGNVANVKSTSEHISGRIQSLNDAKNGLMEIISDLSAISEENAASTEETNASMEELNATFTMISESANRLQTLASDLEDTVSYFKVE